MSRPWMPFYVADYLRDTRRLTPAEHGAYLHLILEYWTAGELPDDDRQLARIAGMTPAEWKRARPNVQVFFHDGWKHKRIDAELAKSADISSKRSASAKLKHINSSANAEQMDTQSQSQSQLQKKEEEKIGADAPAGKVLAFGFDGLVTHWDQKTLTKWRKDFPAIDLDATLRMMDAYYAEHPRPDGKYFFPAQKWLEKESREAPERAKKAARDKGDAW